MRYYALGRTAGISPKLKSNNASLCTSGRSNRSDDRTNANFNFPSKSIGYVVVILHPNEG